MTHNFVQAVVLAAGKSARFNTRFTKLTHTICGQEIIAFPLKALASLHIPTTIVLGYQKEVLLPLIKKYIPDAHCTDQVEQKGTGHAVLCTRQYWHADNILIINGDAPLIHTEDLKNLIKQHTANNSTISFLAAYNADPTVKGYGRIIDQDGNLSIVEQRDFTGDPEVHCRLNAGVYLIKRSFLERVLPNLDAHNAQGEIYITDLIMKASQEQEQITIVDVPFDHVRGVNTLTELWVAEHIKKSELISDFMDKGVRFLAPQSVTLDLDVSIGSDTTIGHGVHLRKGTHVGNNVTIDAFSIIDASHVADNAFIGPHSVISGSTIGNGCSVGPFARIHRESTLEAQSVVGNFVEVTRTTLGEKSKAKHLAYLGNAQLGSNVSVGAGAITCNYNGVTKHTTTIEDHAFIGTNATLIAPVTIGQESIVAAGSVITENVSQNALAIARQRQITKEQYASKLKKQYQEKKQL